MARLGPIAAVIGLSLGPAVMVMLPFWAEVLYASKNESIGSSASLLVKEVTRS